MKDFRNDICKHCGATEGIHQYETGKCPKWGKEEVRMDRYSGEYLKQQWDETTFKDSGMENLRSSAPDLYDELISSIIVLESNVRIIIDGTKTKASDLLPMLEAIIDSHKKTIKKAKS